MKLKDYIVANNLNYSSFARLCKLSPAAIHYFCHGKRTPSQKAMKKIKKCTNGEVAPNDFFE